MKIEKTPASLFCWPLVTMLFNYTRRRLNGACRMPPNHPSFGLDTGVSQTRHALFLFVTYYFQFGSKEIVLLCETKTRNQERASSCFFLSINSFRCRLNGPQFAL